jgi:hypothetical protein
VNTALKIFKSRIKKLNYNIFSLYELKKTMLPRYFELMKRLNDAAIDDGLKFMDFLKFDDEGLPSGRPWSYFCSTLNDKKQHDEDDDRESRKAYLSRIGISDYYEVYDMKSQVPRMNYLFQTGAWKPDSCDFYDKILKNTEAWKWGKA